MKTSLTITDVTRMQEGRVCVAGYDKNGKCIRPVLPHPGIHERALYLQGRPIVFPFAVVEYDLLQPTPQPPHTEDYRYDPTSVRFVERLDEKRKRRVLDRTLFASIKAIFEVPIILMSAITSWRAMGRALLGQFSLSKLSRRFTSSLPKKSGIIALALLTVRGQPIG